MQGVAPSSVYFYLGLTLKPGAGSSPRRAGSTDSDGANSGASNGGDGSSPSGGPQRRTSGGGGASGGRQVAGEGDVVVVFPHLRPRLSLLRQAYQQLQPLLQYDMEAMAAPARGDAAGGAPAQ